MEQVRRVEQRLGQQRELAHRDRQLAALGDVDRPLDPDQVADVELLDTLEELVAEGVAAGVPLDRAGDVADVEEDRLAVAPLAGHPAHHPVGELLVLALPQRLRVVGGLDVLGVGAAFEGVRVGIDAGRAEPLDLGAALRLAGGTGAIAGRIRRALLGPLGLGGLAHRIGVSFMERSRQSPARHLHSPEG